MLKNIALFLGGLGFLSVLLFYTSSHSILEPLFSHTCPDSTDMNCILKVLTDISVERGLPEGFRALREHYAAVPDFRPNCHSMALSLGEALAHRLPHYEELTFTPESAACNYGFFQSYPNDLLLSGAPIAYVSAFCKDIGTQMKDAVPDLEDECFRGIGRALPFIDETSLGDSIKMIAFADTTCTEISPGPQQYRFCLSGAFNQLGRKEATEDYGLSVDEENPLLLCERQQGVAKESCDGNCQWTAHCLFLGEGDFSTGLQ